MSHYHMHTKEFLVGAVVGSLLGSVAALLSAPKSGKNLRDDLCGAYCHLSDKTQDLARKGKCLAKGVAGYKSDNWTSRAKSTVDGIKRNLQSWVSHDDDEEEGESEGTRDLLVGALAGSLFGAVIGLLLAPKPGEELVQDIVDKYEDVNDLAKDYRKKGKAFAKTARSKANKWIDFAKEVVDDLSENTQETGENLVEKAKGLVQNDRLNDLIDWASLGYRVWQGIKSKR